MSASPPLSGQRLDEIGRRYLLLVLRFGRHLPDLVLSCVAPRRLQSTVAGEPRTRARDLHDEARRLLEAVEADESGNRSREAFLRAQLTADRTPAADPLAEDQAVLEVSRQRILATVDRVVPGHGEPFETGRSG